MAFERGERGERLEQYPRREESEANRKDRKHDERGLFARREIVDDDETRPAELRRWRGHDYYDADDERERGRDYSDYDGEREPRIGTEHRNRFLRRGDDDERNSRRDDMRPYRWRGSAAYRDDDRGAGLYVGRGPKGYRRSDERILEDICERLTDHPSIDASDIEVNVSDGDVTLTGRVESRTVKHLTENMVETVSGVKKCTINCESACPQRFLQAICKSQMNAAPRLRRQRRRAKVSFFNPLGLSRRMNQSIFARNPTRSLPR